MSCFAAAKAQFVVHAAFALFRFELAVGAEDVGDASRLVGLGGRRGRGVGLLLVLFLGLLTVALTVRIVLTIVGALVVELVIVQLGGLRVGGFLVVVKVSKPRQDMRFDVPVVGLRTVEVMHRCKVTALAMDAGRTLLFDRARVIEAADAAGIAIEAFPLEDIGVAERTEIQGKQ